MIKPVIIVTGSRQTGSKHFYDLKDALKYVKKLMEGGQDISVKVVQ